MRRFFSSHVVLLGIVTAAVVALDIFFDVVVDPRLEERAGLLYEILAFFELAYALFLCSLLIMGVVLLLRRKLFLSVCYLVAGVVAYESSYYIEGALKDDRVIFPSASHREIAAIYRQQDVDFDLTNPKPHLVSLDDRCHPPGGCGCWVLIDPGHSSGVENDLGGWHQPTAKIFPQGELPVLFEFVNVRVLDSSAYSVLACGIDFPSFRPGW